MIARILRFTCVLAAVGGAASRGIAADAPSSASPLRLYTFEDVSIDSPVAESSGTESEPLKYAGADTLTVVEGRSPERKAVRLDNGAFQGKAFAPSERGCTVETWFRKNGQGAQLGNGRTNGMIFCLGSGYWDGMRLSTSYPDRRLSLEIGRPKPSSSISTQMNLPVPDGVWQHVAVTWDRAEMSIYWNGLLMAVREFQGDWTPASTMRIGFAGSGIGSLKMDVDEFAVYDEPLSTAAIVSRALGGVQLPEALKSAFSEAAQAIRKGEWPAAELRYQTIADDTGLDTACRATATMGIAQSLWRQNRMQDVAVLCAKLYEMPGAPQNLREAALRLCFSEEPGVVRAAASVPLFRRLLELLDTTPRQRAVVRLALAERLLADGAGQQAIDEYSAAIDEGSLTDLETWNTRLQMAHSHLSAREFHKARDLYKKLATAPTAPRELRSLASLSMGHSYERQGDLTQAGKAYDAASRYTVVLPHHRVEALERCAETRRLMAGLPRRDPTISRTKLPRLPKPGAIFYVATDGKDTNPGTESAPFASLARARDAIADRKKSGGLPKGGVTVLVRAGMYPVDSSFTLTEADGGTAESPIVYQAYPGEKPIFTGGKQLAGFKPVVDPEIANLLPETVRDQVVVTDLPSQGIEDYGKVVSRGFGLAGYPGHPWVDLYVDDEALDLARWPNRGFVKTGPVHGGMMHTDQSGQPGIFEFIEDRPGQWQAADDVWAFGYWGHLWAGRSVPLASMDGATKRITTGARSSYGFKEGMPYYLFNVLEELDEPGEWYLDRSTGKLYLLPPKPLEVVSVELPILAEPMVIIRNAENVSLRGLTFELGRAEGAVIEGGANNLLTGCVFRKLGTNGVIVTGGTGHGIVGCDIHTLGAGGVRAAGGNKGTLTPGKHFIENCHIYDFTRIDRAYAPAVHLDGVGNRIAHNLFHHSPHHAMRVEGYEHRIEWNEIHSVVYESDDQSGIDMFGNPAVRGNMIRYNFWHHIGSGHNVAGQAGIRLDDFISGVLIYSNVFYRCAGGRFGAVQIHGGKDNMVDNNLFVGCKYALSFSPWGEKRWLERLARDTTQRAVKVGGVDITKPPHITRYPDLADLEANPDRNCIWRSLVMECGQFSTRDRGVNELLDNHMLPGYSELAEPDQGDFRLDEKSPIYDRFGFRPIPFEEIGLYQDENRATWPVEHEVTPMYVEEY
jgi:concanavalin A-like lectin/glucanase superfamily protein/parallel beta helix pectate lyase-like protein